MIYNRLGNSGLKVSLLSFGNWQPVYNDEIEANQLSIIKRAVEAGINFFDTAEVYGKGIGEELLGKAVKTLGLNRSDLVISTKIYWGKPGHFANTNENGLSKKHIFEAMASSLKRLQMDYVDIVFCHRPDHETSLEETCRAMSALIEKGQALYWGTSEWPACYISAAIEMCKKWNLHEPVAEQCEYNMLKREKLEVEYAALFELYKYGTTTWSPLAYGILSGKYKHSADTEEGRLNTDVGERMRRKYMGNDGPKLFEKLEKLQGVAKKLGCSQAQLSLLWAIQNKDVTTCLLGARNMQQFEENLAVLQLISKWTLELENEINEILENEPAPFFHWRKWTSRVAHRKEVLLHQ